MRNRGGKERGKMGEIKGKEGERVGEKRGKYL